MVQLDPFNPSWDESVHMTQHIALTASQALAVAAPVQPRINQVRGLVLVLPWLGFLWQWFLASSITDILSSLLAATGSFLILYDCFRQSRIFSHPLSSLVLIGFAVTLQLGPLFFTAMEGNSINYKLQVPLVTFGHCLLTSIIAIFAHSIYRSSAFLLQFRKFIQKFLIRLHIFKPLDSNEVIWMGALGTFALGVSSWFGNQVTNTVAIKFILGFDFLSIIPASFLLGGLWGKNGRLERNELIKPLLIFLVFQALIVVTSLGRGSRGTFLIPIVCLVIGFVLEWLFGLIRIRLSVFISVILAVFLVLPTVTDLSSAIVMARFLRGDVPAQELLAVTLDLMKDRETLRQYTIGRTLRLSEDKDDTYVSNAFLARFANARYPDISLSFSQRIKPAAGLQMAQIQLYRILSIVPGPFLDLFGLSSIKDFVLKASIGDYLISLADTGTTYAAGVGSFFVGHFFGAGMAGFGYGYLLILLIGLLLTFPLVDSCALLLPKTTPIISALAITQLYAWLTFSGSESVVEFFIFAFREFIEPVLLFALIRSVLVVLKVA